MSENCPVCGLPKELCVCSAIAKEQQKIIVRAVRGKFQNSFNTIIEGIDAKGQDLRNLVKQLKQKLACGGTFKDNVIELQGDHRKKVKELLMKLGFQGENIEVRAEIG
jgi:translation initiation factor 1